MKVKIVKYGQPHKGRRRGAVITVSSLLFGAGFVTGFGTRELTRFMFGPRERAESNSPVNLGYSTAAGRLCTEQVVTPVGSITDHYIDTGQAADSLATTAIYDIESPVAQEQLFADYLDQQGVEYHVVWKTSDLPESAQDEPDAYATLDNYVGTINGADAIRGLRYFPPEMVQELNARFYLVGAIDSDPDHPFLGSASGTHTNFFDKEEDFQDLITHYLSSPGVYVHELAHALQNEVCARGDRFRSVVAALQADGKRIPYLNSNTVSVEPWLSFPWKDRQFAIPYGAKNEFEDWATIVTDMLTERGMVLEGDEDWGSPFQQVQYAIIADIEARFPGFTQSLLELTAFYRISPHGSYNIFKAAEVSIDSNPVTVEDLSRIKADIEVEISEAYSGTDSITYMHDTTFIISGYAGERDDELGARVLSNPILYLDPYTHRYYIITARPQFVDKNYPLIDLIPYEPSYVTILAGPESMPITTQPSIDQVSVEPGNVIVVNGQPVAVEDVAYVSGRDLISFYQDAFTAKKVLYPKDFTTLLEAESED